MSSSFKNLWSKVKVKINKSGQTSRFKGPTTSQLFGINPPAIPDKSALAKKIQSQIISDKASAQAAQAAQAEALFTVGPHMRSSTAFVKELRKYNHIGPRVGGYKKTRKNKKTTKHTIRSRKHRK